jgi:hypothetical protein
MSNRRRIFYFAFDLMHYFEKLEILFSHIQDRPAHPVSRREKARGRAKAAERRFFVVEKSANL